MEILFVLVLTMVLYGVPIFITAWFLERRDRNRTRHYPSVGSRALKIALAWTVILAVVMFLYRGFRPVEEILRFVLIYILAYFCIWLIRKKRGSDFKVEASGGEDVAYVPLDKLTEKQRDSIESLTKK